MSRSRSRGQSLPRCGDVRTFDREEQTGREKDEQDRDEEDNEDLQ